MYRILDLNPQLEPFAGDIDLRMHLYRSAKKRILSEGQNLNDFANAHMYFGFHHVDGGWYYREWAPSAYQLYLEGEFNGWNQTSHPLTNLGNGNWELYLPGDDALWDGCKVKTVVDANLTRTEHIPLYARRVVQNKQNITFECEVVDDRKAFPWTDKGFTGEDCISMRPTLAWRRRRARSVPTGSLPTTSCRESTRRGTIPSSSWPLWSIPITAPSAIR